VLITPKSYYEIRHQLQPLLEDLKVEFNRTGRTLTEKEMEERIADVDGLLVGIDPVTQPVLKKASKLRAISKYGVGVDNIDLKAINQRKIPLKTAPATNAVSVAELTIGLILNLCRYTSFAVQNVKNGKWDRKSGIEITGKTIGLIGCGNIGKEVAYRAQGLCMSVIMTDPYFKDHDFLVQYGIEQVPMGELLSRADFVSLHLPLTDESRKIIGRNQLAQMKSSAYIVNTSRGGLVDEQALYQALSNGTIAGAACDVFTQEPPGDHPLLQLDNFMLTPHIGAYTQEAIMRMAIMATENLISLLEIK
jgi:D-3-phosphoglycerate dehydrogenase